MEKPFQLELFKNQKYQSDTLKKERSRSNFFEFIRLYEKAILSAIVVLIISLISFSLGLEKGKKLNLRAEPKSEQMVLTRQQPQPAVLENKLLEDKIENSEIAKFTIQVASFKTMAYAKKEAERLEKKGLKTLIISKGKYVCVCVGSFSERQDASLTLSQLKKIYSDCYIRRL